MDAALGIDLDLESCRDRPEFPSPESRPRLTSSEIRAFWIQQLEESVSGTLSYEEVWQRLVGLGYELPGKGRKGQLRNVYQSAAADARLSKVAPGIFGLVEPSVAPMWLSTSA
jgi:hypothetical protein